MEYSVDNARCFKKRSSDCYLTSNVNNHLTSIIVCFADSVDGT